MGKWTRRAFIGTGTLVGGGFVLGVVGAAFSPSRHGVMRRAIPKTLVDQVGLETLLQRLPEAYQRALFSSWVASHFVSSLFCGCVLGGN